MPSCQRNPTSPSPLVHINLDITEGGVSDAPAQTALESGRPQRATNVAPQGRGAPLDKALSKIYSVSMNLGY